MEDISLAVGTYLFFRDSANASTIFYKPLVLISDVKKKKRIPDQCKFV